MGGPIRSHFLFVLCHNENENAQMSIENEPLCHLQNLFVRRSAQNVMFLGLTDCVFGADSKSVA